jgi:hypothetical protein
MQPKMNSLGLMDGLRALDCEFAWEKWSGYDSKILCYVCIYW